MYIPSLSNVYEYGVSELERGCSAMYFGFGSSRAVVHVEPPSFEYIIARLRTTLDGDPRGFKAAIELMHDLLNKEDDS